MKLLIKIVIVDFDKGQRDSICECHYVLQS